MSTFEVAIDNERVQVHCHDVAPPSPIVIDVPATEGRLVRDSPTDGYHTDTSGIALTATTTIDFYAYFGGPTGDTANYLYFTKFDGIDGSTVGWIPETPAGYSLADVRPYIIGYVSGGPQVVEESTGWIPNAEKSPFVGVTSSLLSFDTFSASYDTGNPKQIAGGNYPTSWATIGGAYSDPIHLVAGSGGSVHIIFQGYGFRFTYNPL